MDETREDIAWLKRWRNRIADDPAARGAFQFQEKLLASQVQTPRAFAGMVAGQVRLVVEHALRHVPYYRDVFARPDLAAVAPGSPAWQALPMLQRATLQERPDDLRAEVLPPGHHAVGKLRSSGSIGQAVEVQTTNINDTWQRALALRAAIWTRRDFSCDIAVIRRLQRPDANLPDGAVDSHWADLAGFPFKTGKRFSLEAVGSATHEQFAWLQQRRPAYLMTYPSLLGALADIALETGSDWRPRGITSVGEQVDDEARIAVRDAWGVPIDDVYSAEEVGVIAIQCPSHGSYHIQSEALFVEIVDDDGRTCAPGQEGRVLITTLANFATPLIRYAIGDRAVAGDPAPCGCGRRLPTIARMLGRERNLMVTEAGTFWQSFGTRRFRRLAPIAAQQFRQTARDRIEMHYVSPRPLTGVEHEALRQEIAVRLPVRMDITLVRVDQLQRHESGKFEIFIRTFD